MARLALGATPPMPGNACFHAQQAAEKFLKAFLVARGSAVPRTHDLDLLLDLCQERDAGFVALSAACEALNEFGSEARYPPGSLIPLNELQAREALALAERIAAFVRARLEPA
jgi:HEPN domain-containing protein